MSQVVQQLRCEAYIERLIALLDLLGDTDLEDNGDCEPSLCSTSICVGDRCIEDLGLDDCEGKWR